MIGTWYNKYQLLLLLYAWKAMDEQLRKWDKLQLFSGNEMKMNDLQNLYIQ